MSVHNESYFLKQSIESILNQTFDNFEFLIVSDFSNLKVKKILSYYKNKDTRIKIFKNKSKLGLTKSLIKAIRYAKGKFIARIDSDDISKNNRFEKQLEWFKFSKDRVLCGTNYFIINKFNKKRKQNVIQDHKDIWINMLYKNCFVHSSTMFRLKTYKKIGGYNHFLKYAQDYDLWSRFCAVGEVGNLNMRLTYIRYHNKSISQIKKLNQTLNSIIISCNNYFYQKKKKFFTIKKKSKENLNYIRKIDFLKNFLQSIIFLNRKKLPKNYYLKISDLNLKSILYCIKQPKMFLLTLIKL